MAIQITHTWGCVCRAGRVCAHHAMIRDIEASGVGLRQRLAVVEYSTLPAQAHEAAIIRAELRDRARQANVS